MKQRFKDAGLKDAASAYSSDPGFNKVDWHVFSVEIWMSHDTVQAIIIAGATAAGTVIAYYFPTLIPFMVSSISVALISFYSDKWAEPLYIDIGYFGDINSFHTY